MKSRNEKELGFGNKRYQKTVRFLNSDGSINISRGGLGLQNIDLYNWFISSKHHVFYSILLIGYLVVNLVFGCVYYLIGAEQFGGIDTSSEFQKFISLFFFSAQTITTLGYGHIYPVGNAASVAAAFESLLGLLAFAIVTGILFGRFSRPKAHLEYSKNLLIAPYGEIKGLMFRISNKKQYELIEAEASVMLSMNDPRQGKRIFLQLPLEISKINFLTLAWTIVHPIDEKSPFYGLTVEDLEERDMEVMILMQAVNDAIAQTVYSRFSYKANDIVVGAKFRPMKTEPDAKGRLKLNVTEVHHFDVVEK